MDDRTPSPTRLDRALTALRTGQPVLLFDDADRENEADFVFSAVTITTEQVALMIRLGGGLICVPLTTERAAALELEQMVPQTLNQEFTRCAFTVSVDARVGVGSGIAASDRATTIRNLANLKHSAKDFVRPGHIFPLAAHPGGLAARRGHTEAALELLTRANLPPIAAICEVLDSTGRVASRQSVLRLAAQEAIPWLTIDDLAPPHQLVGRSALSLTAETTLPTAVGTFRTLLYTDWLTNQDHLVLIGDPLPKTTSILVRLHSRCTTGDALSSLRCDCGAQLHESIKQIQASGGVLMYLDQEGRGVGLRGKVRAYQLQDQGLDTVDAQHSLGLPVDSRSYQAAAEILNQLSIKNVRLLTNNPRKLTSLQQAGLSVTRQSLEITPTSHSAAYLATKRAKLNHMLTSIF